MKTLKKLLALILTLVMCLSLVPASAFAEEPPVTEVCAHTPECIPAVTANCTESGNIAYYRCSLCGGYFADESCAEAITPESVVIPATGHSPVTDAAVEATAEQPGLTEGSHCSVCNAVLAEQTPVEYTAPEESSTPEETPEPEESSTPEETPEPEEPIPLTLSFINYKALDENGGAHYEVQATAGVEAELCPEIETNGTLSYQWQIYTAAQVDCWQDIGLDRNATAQNPALVLIPTEDMLNVGECFRCVITAALPGAPSKDYYAYFTLISGAAPTANDESGELVISGSADSSTLYAAAAESTKPVFDGADSFYGYVNEYQSFVISAVGSLPISFGVSGALPEGMELVQYDSDYVDISGTPTGTGTYTFTLTATGDDGSTAEKEFTITIKPHKKPTFRYSSMTGFVNENLSFTIFLNDSVQTSFAYTGALPPGMDLVPENCSVSISGTPTAAGTYTFILTATNDSASVDKEFTITIKPQEKPTFTFNGTMSGYVNEQQSFMISVMGSAQVSYAVTGGILPDGMELVPENNYALISGTPNTVGTYTFTVEAENGAGTTDKEFTITIKPPEKPTFTPLGRMTCNVEEVQRFQISAVGSSPISFAVTGGVLPLGMQLDSNNDNLAWISGTPSFAGTYKFTITATNVAGFTEKEFTITIKPQEKPTFNYSSDMSGFEDENKSFQISASGSTQMSFAVTGGALPAGMELTQYDSNYASISGMPTATGTYIFTITATNDVGSTAKEFTITIKPREKPFFQTNSVFYAYVNCDYNFPIYLSPTSVGTIKLTGGLLPDGMELAQFNNYNANIVGTPTETGDFSIELTASNLYGSTQQNIHIVVLDQEKPILSTNNFEPLYVNEHYLLNIQATGSENIIFAVTGGELPDGIVISQDNYSSASISGIPTTPGAYTFTLTATNDVGSTEREFTLFVKPQEKPIFFACGEHTVSVGKNCTISLGLNALSKLDVSVTEGKLPDGLMLGDANIGFSSISGIPTKPGNYSFTLTATNAAGSTSKEMLIVVTDMNAPTFNCRTNMSLRVDSYFSTGIFGLYNGADELQNVKVSGGTLPPGIDLISDAQGVSLFGTPTTLGTYTFELTAENEAGLAAKKFRYTVLPAYSPLFQEKLYYIEAYAGSQVVMPYTYDLIDRGMTGSMYDHRWSYMGDLPEGLMFDTLSGEISGYTDETGTYELIVTAFSNNASDSCVVTLDIKDAAAPEFDCEKEFSLFIGAKADFSISARGSGKIKYSVTAGSLPPGMTLVSNGIGTSISGTAEQIGSYSFEVTAENNIESVSEQFTIDVQPLQAPEFEHESETLTIYSDTYANNGFPVAKLVENIPCSWSCDGMLPEGLYCNGNYICGMPGKTGTGSITLTAKNEAGEDSCLVTVNVVDPSKPVFDNIILPELSVGTRYTQDDPAIVFPTSGSYFMDYKQTGGSLPDGMYLSKHWNEIKSIYYVSLNGKPSSGGDFTFTLTAANTEGETSKSFTVHVNGESSEKLAINSIIPDRVYSNVDTAVTWTVNATGGVGTKQYCFSLFKEDGTAVDTSGWSELPSYSFTFPQAGNYYVEAFAKDTNGTLSAAVRSKDVHILSYYLTIKGVDSVRAGKSVKLTGAFLPSNLTNTNIVWSLAEGDEQYAALRASGSSATVTAKTVTEEQLITVKASSADGAAAEAEFELRICPVVQSVEIRKDETAVNGDTLLMDMHETPTIQLTALTSPEDASDAVTWSSSSTSVATVDKETGLVTGIKPGVATIKATAADGSGKYATVKVQVIYVDTATRLSSGSANEPIPKIGLQKGNTTQMQVFGTDKTTPMEPSLFTYSIPASQSAIATVDENGEITAGAKPGAATVTATLTGDPLRRKVTLSVKVIALQTGNIVLTPVVSDALPELVMLDADGNVTADESLAVRYELVLDKTALGTGTGSYNFTISPTGTYSDGTEIAVPDLKYVSSDTGIAAVSVARDGTVTVDVKKGAAATGECTITGTSMDLAKIANILTIQVRDYAPRIGASSLTLNPKLTAGVSTELLASYGNTVNSVELYENGIPSSRLSASFANDTLTILPIGTQANASVKAQIKVSCDRGEYTIPVTVTLKNAEPSISIKQSEKFNLFYKDSEVDLTVKATGCTVENIVLKPIDIDSFADASGVDGGNIMLNDIQTFVGTYNAEDGSFTIGFADNPAYNEVGKPYSKLTLLVYVDGYTEPIETDFTLSTVTTKPSLSCTPASSVINTAIGEPETLFTIYDKTAKSVLDLDTEVSCADAGVIVTTDLAADTVALTWNRSGSGRATVSVQNSNWIQPINLTHSVTVQTALPTAKLSASTLKLSNIYTDVTADASLTLSQMGVSVKNAGFESTAKGAVLTEANKLELSYADGVITAGIKDGETPKAGTYSFKVTPWIEDQNTHDVPLRTVTLIVSVAATAPKVSLASSTVKLNGMYPGETAAIRVKLSLAGYEVTDIAAAKASGNKLSDDAISIWLEDGVIKAKLSKAVAKGSYSYLLTPTVKHIESAQNVELTPLTLKMSVYSSAKVSATVVTSNAKLDALDRENSTITYTVTRLTNITGALQSPELLGADADKFELSELTENAKGQPTVTLKLRSDEDYATNVTYKVQLGFDVDGIPELQVKSPVLSVKVSQSAIKLKLDPTAASVFQSATSFVSFDLQLSSPVGAKIDSVSVSSSTTLALRQALGNDPVDFDPTTGEIRIPVADTSRLKVGGSYTLVLDVTPEGMATNLKPTQVKASIKAFK